MCYGKGLRALRKFLPKPYFVQTEGALEKFLMIINSHDEVLPLVGTIPCSLAEIRIVPQFVEQDGGESQLRLVSTQESSPQDWDG